MNFNTLAVSLYKGYMLSSIASFKFLPTFLSLKYWYCCRDSSFVLDPMET